MSYNKSLFMQMRKESKQKKTQPKPKDKLVKPIVNPMGQWAHPGEITVIPGDSMATHGYGNIPLYVEANNGFRGIIPPNSGNFRFPGATQFTEYPLVKAQTGFEQPSSLELAKIKAKMAMASHFGNPSARRMTTPYPQDLVFKLDAGPDKGKMGRGTHWMYNEGNYAVPIIQEGANGKLFFNQNVSPSDREAMRFDSPEEAASFAKYYKYVAPMSRNNFENGGDISIPNLEEGNWLDRYDEGGFVTTDATTLPKETRYVHNPSVGGKTDYAIRRTVTPYKTEDEIRKFTQMPTSGEDVDFLYWYRNASNKKDAMSVPFKGDKHWNIDRGIIDVEFGNNYPNLNQSGTTVEQNRNNVLADMYKYYMLQYPNNKDKAWRKARRFVRKQVDPRINNEYFKDIILNQVAPNMGTLTGFANQNPFKTLKGFNEMFVDNPATAFAYHPGYNPSEWTVNRMKGIAKDYLRDYKGLSRRETRRQIRNWENEYNKPNTDIDTGGIYKKPECPEGYEFDYEVQDCFPKKQNKGQLQQFAPGGSTTLTTTLPPYLQTRDRGYNASDIQGRGISVQAKGAAQFQAKEEQAILNIQKQIGVSRPVAQQIRQQQTQKKSNVTVGQDKRTDYERKVAQQKVDDLNRYREKVLGIPKGTTQADIDRNRKQNEKLLNAIEVGTLLEAPVSLGARALTNFGTKTLPALGEYLTTQTPLRNTYKLNPWRFKPNPEAYYRGVGKEGIEDALKTGLIRSKNMDMFRQPYFARPGEFETALYYNPEALVEAKGFDVLNLKGKGPNINLPKLNFAKADAGALPVTPKYTEGILGKPETRDWYFDWDVESIPVNHPDIKLLQKDWLRGYKEVPKPTSTSSFVENIAPPPQTLVRDWLDDNATFINLERDSSKPKSKMYKASEVVEDPNFNIKKIYRGDKEIPKVIRIQGKSGEWTVNRSNDGSYYFNAAMSSPLESGKAMLKINEMLPPKPVILEPNSLSLDSYLNTLKLGKKPHWKMEFENYIPLNHSATNNKILSNKFGFKPEGTIVPFSSLEDANTALKEVNAMLKKQGIKYEADVFSNGNGWYGIKIPNFKLTRDYKKGGQLQRFAPGGFLTTPTTTKFDWSTVQRLPTREELDEEYERTRKPTVRQQIVNQTTKTNKPAKTTSTTTQYNMINNIPDFGTKEQIIKQQKLNEQQRLKKRKLPSFSLFTLEDRQNIYNTIRPSDYFDINNYARYLFNNEREEFDDERSEEAFRIYLGLENKPKYFRPSIYVPTINKSSEDEIYYSVDPQLEQEIFESYKDKVKLNEILKASELGVNSYFDESDPAVWEENGTFYKALVPGDDNLIYGRPMVSNARTLGKFVVSRGKDKKGEYLSYADQYDFPDWMQERMKGRPYKIYGRIYYPDKKQKGGQTNWLDKYN